MFEFLSKPPNIFKIKVLLHVALLFTIMFTYLKFKVYESMVSLHIYELHVDVYRLLSHQRHLSAFLEVRKGLLWKVLYKIKMTFDINHHHQISLVLVRTLYKVYKWLPIYYVYKKMHLWGISETSKIDSFGWGHSLWVPQPCMYPRIEYILWLPNESHIKVLKTHDFNFFLSNANLIMKLASKKPNLSWWHY